MQFLLNRSKKDYKPPVAVFTLILAVLPLNSSSMGGRTQAVATRECDRSKSGRVVSEGDLYLPPGSRLCTGDRINPSNGSTVKVLCYLNRNFLSFKHTTIFNSEICASLKDEVKRCSVENVDKCLRKFKSPNHNYNKPKVISPYGNSILNTRPAISWYPVAESDRYTVLVEGNDVKWRTEVRNTTLLYPKDQRQLKYGNAYTITVIANKGNSYINDDTTVVNVLPQSHAKQILNAVKQIKSLKLPPDEAAFLDLDAIFMSRRLLNETIETLKIRKAAGSWNPILYRTLGDRYVEARLSRGDKRAKVLAV